MQCLLFIYRIAMGSLKNRFYKTHIFICTNIKEVGKCCGKEPIAKELLSKLKKELKESGLDGEDKIRISSSGCLGRCSEGPAAVSYPEGKWYNLYEKDDVAELEQITKS